MARIERVSSMKNNLGFNEIDATPAPSALMESLRSFGYSPAASVADLIDNSISAGARTIDVDFLWAGPDSRMMLTDDGSGMDEDELNQAMRPGSSNPLDDREEGDLGRFGLGLKTASFSQARVLTVASLSAGNDNHVRCWDLDHVQRTNRWVVLDGTEHDHDLIAALPIPARWCLGATSIGSSTDGPMPTRMRASRSMRKSMEFGSTSRWCSTGSSPLD